MRSMPKPKDVTEIALCRCPGSGPLPANRLRVSIRVLQTGQCTALVAPSGQLALWGSGTNLRWSVVAEINKACRLRFNRRGQEVEVAAGVVVAGLAVGAPRATRLRRAL
jgi:hypothetical protein